MLDVRIFGGLCFSFPLVAVSLERLLLRCDRDFTLGRKEMGMKEILNYFQLAVSNYRSWIKQ